MANDLKLCQADASNQPYIISCFLGMHFYFHYVADTGLQRNLGTSLSLQSNQREGSTTVVVLKCHIAFLRHALGHESHGVYFLRTTATANVESESMATMATCGRRCSIRINRVLDSGSRFVFGIVERHPGISGSSGKAISGPTVGDCVGCLYGSSTGASGPEIIVGYQCSGIL